MSLLWPRLERTVAERVLAELQSLGDRSIGEAWATAHPAQTFASTGGTRAQESDIGALRAGIVAVAVEFGFPKQLKNPIGFDRRMAVRLVELMPMAAAEALMKPVWSFVSLVVAPDVTHWRFVAFRAGAGWNVERWVCTDRTRHMFSRLWWQAHQLAVPRADGVDASLLDGLSESELNHLTERTSIGGCAPLVQALARAVIELPSDDRQREVVRLAAMLVLRRAGVVDPYSMTDDQLTALARSAVAHASTLPSLPQPAGDAVHLPEPDRIDRPPLSK